MGKFKGKKSEERSSKSERIPESTINYYRRVCETLSDDFSSDDDKDIFFTNVVRQLGEDGLGVLRLSITSRLMENFISDAKASHVLDLLALFSRDWNLMITDRFASHVLQITLNQVPRLLPSSKVKKDNSSQDIQNEGSSDEGEDNNDCETISDWFLKLCAHVQDNFDRLCSDVYGSHILRVILQILGGVPVEDEVIRSKVSRDQRKENKSAFTMYTPPEAFKKVFKKLTRLILDHENMKAMVIDNLSSPVLQTLLLVQSHVSQKRCQKYLQTMLSAMDLLSGEEAEEGTQPSVSEYVTDNVSSFLVKLIIKLAQPDLFQTIHNQVFKGRLLQYAVHPGSNFVVQQLLGHCHSKEQFESMLPELLDKLEDILASGHFGLITHMAEGCIKFGCKQDKLLKALMKSFHCHDPVERQRKLVYLLLSMTTYEVFFNLEEDKEESGDSGEEEEKEETKVKNIPQLQEVNYHGAVILQKILQFGNPRMLVSGLIDMKQTELFRLACDVCGSHVIDAFFQSPCVGEKSRESLLNKLKGCLVDMACSRSGSRTIESIWKVASMNQKVAIATEIGKQEAKVRSHAFGQFVHKKFAIGHFLNRRNEWKNLQTQEQKKRKLFQDILGDDQTQPRKKTKKMTTASSNDANSMVLAMDESDDEGNVIQSEEVSEEKDSQPDKTPKVGSNKEKNKSKRKRVKLSKKKK